MKTVSSLHDDNFDSPISFESIMKSRSREEKLAFVNNVKDYSCQLEETIETTYDRQSPTPRKQSIIAPRTGLLPHQVHIIIRELKITDFYIAPTNSPLYTCTHDTCQLCQTRVSQNHTPTPNRRPTCKTASAEREDAGRSSYG